MVKKREILTSPAGPGITGSESGVPQMRGDDPASSVPDFPGVGGLSGVRSGNPDRNTQEVSSGPTLVGKRTIKGSPEKSRPIDPTLTDLSLEEKIRLLNVFRKIRSKPPRVSDLDVRLVIGELYRDWIDEMMGRILDPAKDHAKMAGFDPEEVSALKVLARTIIQRQAGNPAPLPAVPLSKTGENPNPQKAAPMIPRTPLNPGVNTDKYRQAQANFLSELAKMDREDPDSKWRQR